LVVPIAAGLDGWVSVGRLPVNSGSGWERVVAVVRGLDPEPLRDQLRAAIRPWGQPVTPEMLADLRRLAKSLHVRSQSQATLEVLANTLHRSGLTDEAIQVLRSGQYAHPADFWLSFDLAFHLSNQKQHADAARYYSVALAIRPDSPGGYNNLGMVLRDQQ